MRAFRIVTADFLYLLLFSRYKGPKRAKMRFWKPRQSFIFHPILMGFFSLDSSQWELSELFSRFFLSLTVFEIQGAQKGMLTYCQIYHFSQTHYCVQYITVSNTLLRQASTRNIFKCSLLLSTCCGRIMLRLRSPSVSISYRFWDTRGPKGQKHDFRGHIIFLFFIQFWWDFFHWIPLNESFQNCSTDFFYLLPFWRYKGSKREC